MKFRIPTLMLAGLMAAQTLTACGGSASSSDTTAPVVTEPEVTTYEYYHKLEGTNLNGETFTHWHPEGGSTFLFVEEETGDILDDTVYQRNRSVEEQLNCKLEFVFHGLGTSGTDQNTAASYVQTQILSGDDTFDVYSGVQHTGYPGMIAEKMFVDWNEVPNVDLTQPYWFQGLIDGVNYGTKIYMLAGAYSLGIMGSSNCLLFNKRLLKENNIEYPYQMVLDGTWTFDKFEKMVADMTQDLNGDTNIEFGTDLVGYWGWGYEQAYALFMGLGGDIVNKDANNMPVVDAINERNIDVVDRINKFFEQKGAAMEWTTYGIFNTAFQSGLVAFLHGHLSLLTTMRDMEDDFGFVPYPKLDEKQENYMVRVQNTAHMTYIPITNKRLDFTGAVLEVLAAESYNTVIPTYFDTVLTVKTTRDTESEQMVPFILDCSTFWDAALTKFSITNCLKSSTPLTTYFAGVEGAVAEQINTIIETYK
ncbi:MAG: carbohydrate ABC transporter substrate-binding protein [Clostridia bacterium]|nr:carbohydrate ABC transporter substrate-binding protein [Clostridia bacterium]